VSKLTSARCHLFLFMGAGCHLQTMVDGGRLHFLDSHGHRVVWALFMVVVGSVIKCCMTWHCDVVVVVSKVGWDERGRYLPWCHEIHNDDKCWSSSFGCHVAVSDVAPEFRVREMGGGGEVSLPCTHCVCLIMLCCSYWVSWHGIRWVSLSSSGSVCGCSPLFVSHGAQFHCWGSWVSCDMALQHSLSLVMCKGLQTLRGTRVGVRRVRVQVRIF